MSERDDILTAIRAIEAQRELLGQVAVDATIGPLRERLTALGGAPRPAPEAERKQITVMFADLSGFTTLSETADAEDVRNLINACFERLGAVATRFGGYIDKFIGDELMVLFGAPQAMEDHASRALLAALEMRDALNAFNVEHRSLASKPLGMHFGINSGIVIAGGMGLEARREYTVMGDPVNVAARLASEAPTGTIFVGADTCRLVGPGFEFDARGALTLDGRAEQVEVFELTEVIETAQTARSRPSETALLGRTEELHTLQGLFHDVTETRRPRSVAVIGPAGIGKSRILGEFQRWVSAERPGVVLLTGAALPHTSTTPYYVIADLLRRSLGIRELDAPADIRSRLDASLAQLGINDAAASDALATIMAVESDASPLREMTPRERRERLSTAAVDVVRAMATLSSLVLAFEDLHWADDQSIELMRDLFTELSESPILFVTLTRPIADDDAKALEVEAQLPQASHMRLMLAELQDETCIELVHALVPGLETSPEIVGTIVRKGQGNPFFVQAIIGTLLDQEILVRAGPGEGVSVRGVIDDISVPDTVWGVLAERIDRLGAEQKHTIQMAAIIGRVFWEGLVGELAGVSGIGAGLQSLQERDFIEPLGPAAFEGDWEWTFRHVLVQEVAYAGMLRAVRREAHLRVGAWLEQRAGARRGEYAPLLAHHFELGEDWQKTAEFAEEAGDRAGRLFANREARAAYRQGLDALAQLAAEPATHRRIIDITLKLAQVSFFSPTEDVLQSLETAKTLAQALGDETRELRVMTATATWLYQAGRARNAVELAIHCIAAATKLANDELLAVPYTLVGRAMFAMGEYEKCIEMTEKAMALAEAHAMNLDGLTALSPNMSYIAMAYSELGAIEKGAALGLEALRIAERANDHRGIATAHLYLGAVNSSFGRLEECGAHLEAAVAIGQETGDQSVVWVGEGFLGHWHAQRGELETARERIDHALGLAAQVDSFLAIPIILGFRAILEIQRGNFAEAVAFGERGVAVGRESRQQTFEAEAHRALGWALRYAHPDEPARAAEELRASIELHRKTNARVLMARALDELGECLGHCDESSAAREESRALIRELNLDWLPGPYPAPLPGSAQGAREVGSLTERA
ncbi:MAG TPA: adenylate/guanylate cyclase domain-containing protein [Dehalococcoidia bacterium]